MRVLFVTREFPPHEVGGVAKHTYSLARELEELDVSCRVISFGRSEDSDGMRKFVDPWSSVISRLNEETGRDLMVPLDILRFNMIANDMIGRDDFDVVHVEEPYVGSFVRHENKVTTVHDTSHGEIRSILNHPNTLRYLKHMGFFASFGPLFEWASMASSRAVTVPSDHIKRELTGVYRFPGRNIAVIGNGVDLPDEVDSEGAKEELGIPRDERLVLSASQHVARKRLPTLVKAVKLLDGRVDGFRISVLGDGPIRKDLLELAGEYGLGDEVLEFPGWVPEDELELYFQAADIFVMTSEYEAGPISLLEAASRETALVSTDIEGFPSLLEDGREGLIFPVGDYRSLAKSIEELLGDAEMREEMAIAARRFSEGFSWDRIAGRTKRLYESLVG